MESLSGMFTGLCSSGIFTAIAVLLCIYTVKGFVWIIPVQGLYIVSGAVLNFHTGMATSIAGVALCLMTAYSLGKMYRGNRVNNFISRWDNLKLLELFEQQSPFWFSFSVRSTGIIPCDIVSVYCGIKKLPPVRYLAGSLLGMLPGMIMSVMMGANISRPVSVQFIMPVVFHIAAFFISYKNIIRLKKRRNI